MLLLFLSYIFGGFGSLLISWSGAAVDKWPFFFDAPSSSDLVKPPSLSRVGLIRLSAQTCAFHRVLFPTTCLCLLAVRLPATRIGVSQLLGMDFSHFFFFNLFLKIIFLWLLTVGRSGSKRCADWLMAVHHQWLRHGRTHVFYICELCCRSAHPVLRGSAWIIALKWSFNIDL